MTVTASNRGTQSSATTWPVLVPDGTDTHDQFIACFYTANTVDAPALSGWTERADFPATVGNRRVVVYTRTLTSGFSEATVNVVFGSAVTGWWFAGSVNGTFTAIATNEGTWTTSHVAPSVVAAADASCLVTAAGVIEYPRIYATPAGTTELEDFDDDPPPGFYGGGGVLGSRAVSAGATGTTTYTSSDIDGNPANDTERFLAFSAVFEPVGGGTAGNGDPVTVSFAGQDAATGSTLSVTRPAGDVGSQALLAINLKAKTVTVTPASGWVFLGEQANNDKPAITRLYTYTWSGAESETAQNWVLSASANAALGMIVYNGTASIYAQASYSYAETMPTPGVMSTVNGALAVAVLGTGEWPRSVLSPSEWTEHVDIFNGQGPSIAIAARAINIETIGGPVFTPNIGDWYQALAVLITPTESVAGNYLSGQSEMPYFDRPNALQINSIQGGLISFSWVLPDVTLGTRFYLDDGAGRLRAFRDDTAPGVTSASLDLLDGTYTADVVSFKEIGSGEIESPRSNQVTFVVSDVGSGDPDQVVSIRDDGPYVVPVTQSSVTITFTAKMGDGSAASNEALDVIDSPSRVLLVGSAVTLFEEPAATTDESGAVSVAVVPAEFGIAGITISIGGLEHTAVVTVQSAFSESGTSTAWTKPLIRRS